MKKLLATDEGSNCLVPKPVLHLKLGKQFSLELYHGAVNFGCRDGSHFNRHGGQPSARNITKKTDRILQEGKITQGRFSPCRTFFNHAAIIKKLVNKEALSKGLF